MIEGGKLNRNMLGESPCIYGTRATLVCVSRYKFMRIYFNRYIQNILYNLTNFIEKLRMLL